MEIVGRKAGVAHRHRDGTAPEDRLKDGEVACLLKEYADETAPRIVATERHLRSDLGMGRFILVPPEPL
jgi:hypothetical protein